MSEIDSTVSVYKRIDDPWIGLLVLSILIPLFSIIGIIALVFFWRRSRQLRQVDNPNYILNNKSTGQRQLPVQIEDQQLKPYETQVNIFDVIRHSFDIICLENRDISSTNYRSKNSYTIPISG